MKVGEMNNDNAIFAIVNNIPRDYHSSDLRNFFSQIIETKGIKCFHFRHRPEVQFQKRTEDDEKDRQPSPSSNTCCCVVKVRADRYEDFLKMYHRKHWLDSNGESISKVCHISKVRIQNSNGNVFSFFLMSLILANGKLCVFFLSNNACTNQICLECACTLMVQFFRKCYFVVHRLNLCSKL